MSLTLPSIRRALTAAACGLLALPAHAVAADGEDTPLNLGTAEDIGRTAATTPGTGGGSLVRTIVGLAVVLGVIYGLAWILRQVKQSREEQASGAGLRPLATLPLGPNRALHLVRAGTEVVLVGAGEHGVTPVRTYTEDEARNLGLIGDGDDGPADGDPPAPRSAKGLLDQLRALTVIR